MGVRASLSVSIIREGKLWGLFACHHYAPLHLSYPLRTAVELFGELFAYMLDQSESVHSRELAKRSADLHNRLMARLAVGRTLLEDFEPFSAEISSVIPYDGIVCYVDGQFLAGARCQLRRSLKASSVLTLRERARSGARSSSRCSH